MINKIFGPLLARLPENNKMERIWVLAKTDFMKRYYGTSLGIVWALINPIFQLIIYYYVFTVFFNTDITNFSLYLFSGLILWMFFAESTKKGMYTINTNRYLLENIRINKHNIITSGILSNSFALGFNIFVYFLISIFFKVHYNLNLLYLPLVFLNLLILVYGINLILSIVYIYLRDFDHFWDIFLIAAFWANPIVYSETVLYENKIILLLNPVAGIIINMHNCLLFGAGMDFQLLLWDFTYAILIFIIGSFVFRRFSKKVVELL